MTTRAPGRGRAARPVHRPLARRASTALPSASLALALLLAGCSSPSTGPAGDDAAAAAPGASASAPGGDVPAPERLPGVTTSDDVPTTGDPLAAWAEQTPAQPVQVTSTVDGAVQDALWFPPAEPGGALLVHLHSWSDDYTQEVGIPLARWAESAGWGFVQPDFRGDNAGPDATGSPLTSQDVIDAIDLVVAEGGADPERVYVTGYSGGGMASLLLAGRHPDRVAATAAHVPVYDLVSWYAYSAGAQPEARYTADIEAACGADPTGDPAAAQECTSRSPASVAGAVRDARVPVLVTHGADDEVVPVADGLRAFDDLAAEGDRVGAADGVDVDELPAPTEAEIAATRFTDDDPDVLFARTSGAATVAVFDGGHELVYYPALDWLARLDAASRS